VIRTGDKAKMPAMPLLARGLLAATLLIGASVPAAADQNDPALNPLFHQLFDARDVRTAAPTEAQILRVLAQSGSPTADLLLARGTEAMNRGDFDSSLATFTSLLKLAPNFAEGWNRRATLYYLMGNLDASIADLEKVLAFEPRHFTALASLGQIYVIKNQRREALRAFQRALAANPHLLVAKRFVDAVRRMDGGLDI